MVITNRSLVLRLTNERSDQHAKQQQHPKISRQQQATVTAKLRKALPMELPQPIKPFVTRRASEERRTSIGDAGEIVDGDELTNTTVIGGCGSIPRNRGAPSRRRPPSPRTRRSPPFPLPVPSARHHQQHHCHHAFEAKQPAASSAGVTPTHHPATFPDLGYSSRRSSHRPGLSFLENIPSKAFISVASTLVFLGPDAAKRVITLFNYKHVVLRQYFHMDGGMVQLRFDNQSTACTE